MSHTYRQKFTTELAWAITSLLMVGSVQPAPGPGNRTSTSTGSIPTPSRSAPPWSPLSGWWTSNNNLVGYYARYIGTLAGTVLDEGQPTLNLTTANSFTLGHGWGADLTGTYQSRQQQVFFDIQARGQVVVGIFKSLWDKKGNLKLNVADIFYTQKTRATSI